MIILVIVFVIVWSVLIYTSIRNNKVHAFRDKVNHLCYDWAIENIDKLVSGEEASAYNWFWTELPSYDAMLWSIKPLTYENWFTEESLNKMFNKQN